MFGTPGNGTVAGSIRTATSIEGKIEAFLARVVHDTGVPGIAVAVHAGGRHLLVAAGRTVDGGPALGAHHRFHAGCTAKLMLAVVTLELAARGQLDLDDTIGEHLPELQSTVHGKSVRVAHLLSHTSGYRGTHLLDPKTRDLSWPSLVGYLSTAPQLFVPGTVFSYEHTETVLLGLILERASGRDPLELARETLLEPLDIVPGRLETFGEDPLSAGQHDFDPAAGRFVPAAHVPPLSPFWKAAFSSFTLSPADLVAIAEALLPGAGRTSAAPISEDTKERIRLPAVRLPATVGGPLRELLPVAFGLGAAELRGGVHGHNGLTHGQCLALRYAPAERVAVAIGMNAMLPHLRDFVLDTVCAELVGRAPNNAAAGLGFELAELEGLYIGPGRGSVTASLRNDRLLVQIEQAEHRLMVEVAIEEDGKPVARSPLPQLSLGFFREPMRNEIGLMLGLTAYKRIAKRARTTTTTPTPTPTRKVQA